MSKKYFYEVKGFQRGYCPHAEVYFKEAVSIPMYAGMTQSQQEKLCVQLNRVSQKWLGLIEHCMNKYRMRTSLQYFL